MCVRMFGWTDASTHTCRCIFTYAYAHACICTCMYVCMYVCMYACMHLYMYARMYVFEISYCRFETSAISFTPNCLCLTKETVEAFVRFYLVYNHTPCSEMETNIA